MFINIIVIFTVIAAAYGSGQLSVVNSPKSLAFKNTGTKLESTDLCQLVSASIGRSIRKSSDFQGLNIVDPFNTPNNAVIISLQGPDKLNFETLKTISFPINGDESIESLDLAIEYAQEESLTNFVLDLSQGIQQLNEISNYFTDVKVNLDNVKTTLKSSDPVEKSAIEQTQSISALAKSTLKELPAILNIRVDFEGLFADSVAYKEAIRLLVASIEELTESLKKSAGDDVLILIVATKTEHKRLRRAATDDENDNINLAKDYNENYPVIFNIILWFGVVIAFSLLAISYAIATMDPGRDSIIYRMTSTRIKKEN